MTVESAADIAGFFADFADTATYREQGVGAGVSVAVIFDRPTDQVGLAGLDFTAEQLVARVSAASVAAPSPGDTITLGTEVFTVAAVRTDIARRIHTLPLRE